MSDVKAFLNEYGVPINTESSKYFIYKRDEREKGVYLNDINLENEKLQKFISDLETRGWIYSINGGGKKKRKKSRRKKSRKRKTLTKKRR